MTAAPASTAAHSLKTEKKGDENEFKKIKAEKRKLEKQLKEQKERFSEFVTHLAYGYAEMNKDGIITYANRMCARIVGYRSSRNLVGRHFIDFLDKKDWERAFRDLAKTVTEPNDGPRQYNAITKNGIPVPVEVNTLPIKENGEITGFHTTINTCNGHKAARNPG
ncbi:MAG: PAS domain S-box protein [Chitinivibrionales bacterium]|nr:PAS domain S-box protein [Chitinivibrionales bacterium]